MVKYHPSDHPPTLKSIRKMVVLIKHFLQFVVSRSQAPSENRREGVFCCRPTTVEPAACRTQVDAFHASLQAFLENALVPGCLL